MAIQLTYKSETHCISEWSKISGVSATTIRRRYHKGWPPEKCLQPIQQCKSHPKLKLTYNGETHYLSEWAEKTGIRYQTIRTRYNKGLTAKECLKQPLKRHPLPKIVYAGCSLTFQQWAKKLGIDVTIIRSRYYKGWSPKECLFGRKRLSWSPKKIIEITYNGETHGVYGWASILHIQTNTIYNRYYRGWSPKECLFGRQ